MKISYDAEVDALSIIFRETTVTTEEIAQGMTVEYDSEGQLAGIEILDAYQKLGGRENCRGYLGLVDFDPEIDLFTAPSSTQMM